MVNDLLLPRQKRLEFLFYLTIIFALLGPTLGIPITEGFTLTFFRVVFVLLMAGFMLKVASQKSLEASYLFPIRWYAAFFAFWFLYALLSLTWVVSINDAIRYIVFLGMMLLLTLSLPYFIRTELKFWRTQQVLLGVFAAMILFGVFESITLLHLPSSRGYGFDSAIVTSVFHNQNDFATCITLGLPFLITALYLLDLNKRHKWFIYFIAVFSVYVLLATGSRSNTFFAFPLIISVLLVMIPFVMDRKKITKKNLMITLGAILLGTIIVQSMSVAFLSTEARERAKEKLNTTFGMFSDLNKGSWNIEEGDDKVIEGDTGKSVTVRKYLLLNGLHFLAKSHYMGVGAGNIEPLMEGAPKVDKVNMHNWWAEILVDFGVINFTLYMALYFWMLWRLWKLAWKKTSPQISKMVRWGAVSCFAAMVGYFIGGMAPSTAIHFTPMWICYGLSLAVIVLGETQKKQQQSRLKTDA